MGEEFMLQTFLLDIIEDRNEFFLSDQNLAYYTNGDVLYSILKYKELWLRSTVCMNDYKEIRYASEYVIKLLLDNDRRMLESIVNILQSITKIPEEYLRNGLVNMLKDISGGLYLHTYIMCLTEHDEKEFPNGNLQMFNSYGRGNGICIVFDRDKLKPFDLPIYKIHYLTEDKIKKKVNELLERLEDKYVELRHVSNNSILEYLKLFFIHLIVTTKDPGFKQEKEWRLVINREIINYNDIFTNNLREEVECINGIPQIIQKLNLDGNENVLRKIILEPRYEMSAEVLAINQFLRNNWHFEDTEGIIRVSDIPIRR